MLARGRNDTQCTNQFTAPSGVPGHAHPAPVAPWTIIPSQQMSRVDGAPIGSAPGMNMISTAFDEIEHARLNTGGMGKRNLSPTNGRRKTDESTIKAPTNKKPKTNAAATNIDKDFSDEGFTIRQEESVSMSKVTDDEKRKTFLERNRVAAHKCRLKRKQWLVQMQTKVFSTELSKRIQKGHNIFDPLSSSSFNELTDKTWKISYGDGSSASGDCGSDDVTIGGLTIKNQTIELASQLDQQFAQGKGDGLLGLAFPQINTVKTNWDSGPADTPVVNMINQHDIPKEAELFTSAFYSQRDANSPESFYTFGFIDTDLVKRSGEEISWAHIDSSDGFWKFPSASVSVKGKTINLSGNKAIADTGTTLVLVSDEVCEALYDAIPGARYSPTQQGYVFPRSTNVEDLPEFKVAIGNKQFIIQPQDLVFTPADKDNWYGGIQSRGNLPFDIFGDAFLKQIWDQGNKRFGLVPKIEATQNLDPTPTA
ncbi:Aspergillopepsin-1 [Fusarium oxysporum f. sp. cubense]|uniref:Aspergillopepsin-1 n=1 Tax=Fusarium oxysporum f. sp. cubense TaxID=61366 RepID=A0A559LHA1_FUSOC|nr:Aspergillopepsin-1 [Fusarium oxysporum f. sp. cubense]